jgi:hypothetical protein
VSDFTGVIDYYVDHDGNVDPVETGSIEHLSALILYAKTELKRRSPATPEKVNRE